MFVKALFALFFTALALAAPNRGAVDVSEVSADHDLNHVVSPKRRLVDVNSVAADHDLDTDVFLKRRLVRVSDVAVDHDLDNAADNGDIADVKVIV